MYHKLGTLITKMVRALWLAERSFCVRVCKQATNMVVTSRCFPFRVLVTQARISQRFWVQNSTSLLYLPIPSSAETWKIFTNQLCQFCFRLSWNLKREKSVLWKASFSKTRTDYAYKTSWVTNLCVQDFATGKNFSFNQGHNKEFCVFSRQSYFIKAIENFFSFVCIAWYINTRGVMRILDSYAVKLSRILCLYQAMQTRETFSID